MLPYKEHQSLLTAHPYLAGTKTKITIQRKSKTVHPDLAMPHLKITIKKKLFFSLRIGNELTLLRFKAHA
jgi:hypothetical protein